MSAPEPVKTECDCPDAHAGASVEVRFPDIQLRRCHARGGTTHDTLPRGPQRPRHGGVGRRRTSGTYSPAHVQKLFFLIDRELAPHVDGPHFRFEPFHYGPFDREVYRVLDALSSMGRLDKVALGNLYDFGLTGMGQAAGDAILAARPRLRHVSGRVPAGFDFSRFGAWSRRSTHDIRTWRPTVGSPTWCNGPGSGGRPNPRAEPSCGGLEAF